MNGHVSHACLRRAGYTWMKNVWTLDKQKAFLFTCHLPWMAILLNIIMRHTLRVPDNTFCSFRFPEPKYQL